MKQKGHDVRGLRSAPESLSQQTDKNAEPIVEFLSLGTDDEWVAHTGGRVLANIPTMNNEKPTEQESSETAQQSDESCAIQRTSADATKGARKRRNIAKKSTVFDLYAPSDAENPPSLGSFPKVEASPKAQAFSELDVSHNVAARNGSLFSDVWGDACGLPRAFYPLYKWPVFFYLLWLIFSNSAVFFYRTAARQLEPICNLPLIGHAIPLCSGPIKTINITKVVTSQQELDLVMNSVGQNFDLARDMVGYEFAVRDLRVRVAASGFNRRKEIANELDTLIHETKRTAKGLSRFTAKVGKSIDTVVTFDAYAVKTLERIANRQQHVPALPQKVIAFLSPLSAFQLADAAQTEEELKHLFLSTSTRIGDKVKMLIEDSFDLDHGLNKIQETLDRLHELAVDEVGDLPQMDVLRALWTRLAHPDDYSQYQSHEELLTDITNFYKSSSDVMRETVTALNRMEAELNEFRDEFATPSLILKEQPLEITIELLRKSVYRLESGKGRLDNIETGERVPRVVKSAPGSPCSRPGVMPP